MIATNLFKHVPVRRQLYSTSKKKKEEVKKVQDLLMAYGLIKPQARLTLRNNKELVWQKSTVSDVQSALMNVLGHKIVGQSARHELCSDDGKVGKLCLWCLLH